MTPDETASAFVAWNEIWRSESGRADWLEPEPEVLKVAAACHASGAATALDLGCGVGRHAIALATLGFDVTAIDASENALLQLKQAAEQKGLDIAGRQAPMTAIPVPDASQDYVIAWNVIYHGDFDVVSGTVAEIHRVLPAVPIKAPCSPNVISTSRSARKSPTTPGSTTPRPGTRPIHTSTATPPP